MDLDPAKGRVCLEVTDLPDGSAALSVNGAYAGGMIGPPLRLDITRRTRPGENTLLLEPLAPKSVRIVVYGIEAR